MKYFRQFSTIFALVVMLGACQILETLPFNAQPDPTAAAKGSDLLAENALEDSSRDILAAADDIVLAAAMPGDDDDLDPEYSAKQIALEAEATLQPDSLPLVNTDLWQRIRDGFSLEHHLDEARVQSELRWYANHPEYLNRVATRASRYLFHIVDALEQRQMPMELALLPIVESAFDPFAYSHGRASGLWQFIPATGRTYGMQVDYWHDGRRDVRAATTGAINYLDRLHSRLDDDWFLALAAYNSGEGNVRYSMRKNSKAGKPLDFFSLGLLKETRAYVPRLLAISAIIADPAKYNIELLPIANEPYWEMVNTGSQLDLSVAAEIAEISIDELYLLNPAFNKWSTHPDGPHELLLPRQQADTFRVNLAALPLNQRLSWQRHKVKSGESLGVIAQKYNTSVATLQLANKNKGNLIRAGQSLMIPVARGSSETYELSANERLKSRQNYTEKKTGVAPTRYIVRQGDSFWEIAQTFKVSMRALAKWNGMATTETLIPGKELVIFSTLTQPAATTLATLAKLPESPEVIRKVNYRVRSGESLERIASKFNLPVASVKQWNEKLGRKKYIQPGDRVTLYVDVTQTE
ncbi:MAG: LysM peptidoglycan-binding domain-containing protein [SAR86 cluster bacterium]|uniref:LysM peptidoglycan-binding domain-containing protein n=1 Tax=SAR86 cluster bacterium TaxID=2030880 RepID=A0A972VWF5_9GAMM|nr:LysM peptidoglycan-binding domain-containing protein [SAR86 cluster bacterium]